MLVRLLHRAFGIDPEARPLPGPQPPERGPFRRDFWRSPLRGPWLSSILSAALLPLIVICAVTGFLSHVAYETEFAGNSVTGGDGLLAPVYSLLDWPAGFAWLYAVNQGLHVVSGLAAIPLLLAKLWAVIPKLWERPALRSLAHAVERLGLALLVGASLFVFATGVLNIQVYYPFGFGFVPAHYYAAFIFIAALAFHVATKLPDMVAALRARGVVAPLRDDLEHTTPEDPELSDSAPTAPRPATISRRGFVGAVAGGSLGLGLIGAGQSIGGPLRELGLLAPRGQSYGTGPNDFQVNKTAASAGIRPAAIGADWRLELRGGERTLELSRDDLMRLPLSTETLPIACVEGWSTTQRWTGVPLRELGRLAGVDEPESLFVKSIQDAVLGQATLNAAQASDPRSLLALRVNGADLSPDHGFPARIIVPALPGVHNTKWVKRLEFRAV
jgi:hypothetical protein